MESLVDLLSSREEWDRFVSCYRFEPWYLSKLHKFISEERYLAILNDIEKGNFDIFIPTKIEIRKKGVLKKRIVYKYKDDVQFVFQFLNSKLTKYDSFLSDRCYSYRKHYSIANAIKFFQGIDNLENKYILKIDVRNFFNSIDPDILISMLSDVLVDDHKLLSFFTEILRLGKFFFKGNLLKEQPMGAIPGCPISGFCANIYLTKLDNLLSGENANFVRYADDIVIIADSIEYAQYYLRIIGDMFKKLKLSFNLDKTSIFGPSQEWEFLGFGFCGSEVFISRFTINKTLKYIKRTAKEINRSIQMNLVSKDDGVKDFINFYKNKFFGYEYKKQFNTFCWEKWFFPYISKPYGLKEIDKQLIKYIRFLQSGCHSKANYKLRYNTIQKLGFESLYNHFYKRLKG